MSRLTTFTYNNNVFLLFPCGTVKEYPNRVMPYGIKINGSRPYGYFQYEIAIIPKEWVERAYQVLSPTKKTQPRTLNRAVRKLG